MRGAGTTPEYVMFFVCMVCHESSCHGYGANDRGLEWMLCLFNTFYVDRCISLLTLTYPQQITYGWRSHDIRVINIVDMINTVSIRYRQAVAAHNNICNIYAKERLWTMHSMLRNFYLRPNWWVDIVVTAIQPPYFVRIHGHLPH